ncbi:hypothetical protein Slin15195_G130780 [Septoria linicola]|uniref:Uncharacterized protein n=1 Tax=Septoria linicola TaxID=215465 RepID=A0A9Q9ERC5_9PEZI|nr:hypothetical protein Slin14017_G128410 [Septoria linicola]USW59759.1 hypothetical protein Slin15195_G130780 [Septoria linicola]
MSSTDPTFAAQLARLDRALEDLKDRMNKTITAIRGPNASAGQSQVGHVDYWDSRNWPTSVPKTSQPMPER